MRYLVFSFLILICVSCKPDLPQTPAQQIANAHGFKNWNKVSKINYTFNVDVNGENRSKRSWEWLPKKGAVTLNIEGNKTQYNRANIDSTNLRADRGFINDKYWLLAPFNLIWDENATLSDPIKTIAPISNDSLHKITITYPNEGGYTPGDAYDFYYGDDFLIKEWAFRQKNNPKPSLINAWMKYKDFNGIKIATEHTRDQGDWKLYFTNIKVETN